MVARNKLMATLWDAILADVGSLLTFLNFSSLAFRDERDPSEDAPKSITG